LALVGLPVLAIACLGMVMRAFVDGGGNRWAFWVGLLVAVCVVWFLVFRLPL
jgi:hypothetical protein